MTHILQKSVLIISGLFIALALLYVVPSAEALQINCGSEAGTLAGCDGTGNTTDVTATGKRVVEGVVPAVINWFIGILALITIGFLIKGGADLISSLGNNEKVAQARKTITAALVGLFIATMAAVIVQIVTNIGIEGTPTTTPPAGSPPPTP